MLTIRVHKIRRHFSNQIYDKVQCILQLYTSMFSLDHMLIIVLEDMSLDSV